MFNIIKSHLLQFNQIPTIKMKMENFSNLISSVLCFIEILPPPFVAITIYHDLSNDKWTICEIVIFYACLIPGVVFVFFSLLVHIFMNCLRIVLVRAWECVSSFRTSFYYGWQTYIFNPWLWTLFAKWPVSWHKQHFEHKIFRNSGFWIILLK